MKKLILVSLAFCILFIGFNFSTLAVDGLTGEGSETNPYIISTPEEYNLIGTGVYTLDKVYKINDNIGSAAEPITASLGSSLGPVSGKIIGDKNGAAPILYLNINQTADYQGLVAVLTGTVENITIEGKVVGRGFVGGAVGWMKSGVVKNVTNKAEVYSSTDGATGKYIGGIVGAANTAKSEIIGCVNEGAISLKGSGSGIGGIVGHSGFSTNLISSCVNKGSVTATPSTSAGNVGGIVGYLNYGTIELCANQGAITVTRSADGVAGGIVGLGDGTVLKSFNTGTISALAFAGGISGTVQYGRPVEISDCYNIGVVSSSTGIAAGILAPKAGATTTTITIKNTYNIGTVSGATAYFITGALTASSTITVTNNYYLNTLTGTASPSYGEIPKSDGELQLLNIGSNWELFPLASYKYPQLKGNYQEYKPSYGSEAYPYEISTIEEWYNIENDLDAYYVLKNNIGSESEPITTSIAKETPFSGSLSGNGYQIYVAVESTEDFVGIFSKLSNATIKDLSIDGQVIGNDYVGSLAGESTGATLIENCVNYADVTALVKGAGGIIGRITGEASNWSYVKTSKNYGNIVAYDTYAGGLAGSALNYVQFNNCANFGEVETKMDVAGGIAGVCYGEIFYSYNNGKVISPGYAGGITGSVRSTYSRNTLKYVYNTGDIFGTYACGIASCSFDITSKGINLQYAYNIGKATYPIAGSYYELTYNFDFVYYLDGNNKDDFIEKTTLKNLNDLKNLSISGFGKSDNYPFPDLSSNPQLDTTIDFNTIRVTNGENGTVSPSGTIYVRKGATEEFAITPDDGYLIETVLYNSNSVAEGLNTFGDVFKPAQIADGSTLLVTFVKDTSEPVISNTYTMENSILLSDLLEFNLISEEEQASFINKPAAMTFVKFTMKSSITDYGIVFSKTNSDPRIDSSDCVKISTWGYGNKGMFGVFLLDKNETIKSNTCYSRAYLVFNGEVIYFDQADLIYFKSII